MQPNKKVVVVDKRKYPAFTMLYNEELFHPLIKHMPDRTLRVWIVLNSHCNKLDGPSSANRGYWVSYARLEEATGRSRATIARALKELKDIGLVTTQLTQGVNYITLHSPVGLCKNETLETSESCQVDANRDPRCLTQGETAEVSPGDTHNILNKTSSSTSVSGSLRHDSPSNETFGTVPENLEGESILQEIMDEADIDRTYRAIWFGDNCKPYMKGKTLTLRFRNEDYADWVKEWNLKDLNKAISEKWGVRYKVVIRSNAASSR